MVNLSQKLEYEIRGKKYIAYPLSLTKQLEVDKKLGEIDAEKDDTEKLAETYIDVAYIILKEFNDGITKEEIKNSFSLAAILKILTDVVQQQTLEELNRK